MHAGCGQAFPIMIQADVFKSYIIYGFFHVAIYFTLFLSSGPKFKRWPHIKNHSYAGWIVIGQVRPVYIVLPDLINLNSNHLKASDLPYQIAISHMHSHNTSVTRLPQALTSPTTALALITNSSTLPQTRLPLYMNWSFFCFFAHLILCSSSNFEGGWIKIYIFKSTPE